MNQTHRSSFCKLPCKLGLLSMVVGLLLLANVAGAKGPAEGVGTVALAALPLEAQRTQRLIHAGGPFPYAKDSGIFGNFERQLPRRERGFYREYTVETPGARNRGARRIVCGGKQPVEPDACYYTADHYASFKLIAP